MQWKNQFIWNYNFDHLTSATFCLLHKVAFSHFQMSCSLEAVTHLWFVPLLHLMFLLKEN